MSAKSSIRTDVRKFAETTSVRGVPRALKGDDKVIRAIWTTAVIAAFSILLWQTSTVIIRYLKYETTTSLAEGQGEDFIPVFPDITVCNSDPMSAIDKQQWNEYFENTMEKSDVWSCPKIRDALYERFQYNTTENDCHHIWDILQTPSGFFRSLPIEKTKAELSATVPLIVNCSVYDWDWGVDPEIDCMSSIETKWDPDYYHCYTLRIPETRRKLVLGLSAVLYLNDFADGLIGTSSTSISHTMASGVKIAIHNPGTRPDMKIASSAPAGAETVITMTATRRQRLEPPWGTCISKKYLVEEELLEYSAEECLDLCSQESVISQCGCLLAQSTFSNAQFKSTGNTVCGNQTLASQPDRSPGVTTATGSDIDELEGFADILCSTRVNVTACNECTPPCNEWIYHAYDSSSGTWPSPSYQLAFYNDYIKGSAMESKFTDFGSLQDSVKRGTLSEIEAKQKVRSMDGIVRNFLMLKIMFESSVADAMVDKPSLTMDGVWASLGGVLSLWLGINVMTAVELIELLYVSVRNRYRLRSVSQENDAESDQKKTDPNSFVSGVA